MWFGQHATMFNIVVFGNGDLAFLSGIQCCVERVIEFARHGIFREDQNGHINEGRPKAPLEFQA